MWNWLLAASPDPLTLSQYGLAGIMILGLATALVRKDNEVTRLNADRIAREQALSDKLGPLLAEAIHTLSTTPDRFERALAKVEEQTQASLLERTVARMLREQTKRVEDT